MTLVPINNRELSIQVTLGGFSFRILSLDDPYRGGVIARGDFAGRDFGSDWRVAQGGFQQATVCWSTPNVTTIPLSLFDERLTLNYLSAVGIIGVESITNPSIVPMYGVSKDVVVVWAADSNVVASIDAVAPIVANSHPLLLLIDGEVACRECVKVYVDQYSVAHIVIWDYAGLLVSESVQITSPYDLLYLVRRFSLSDPFMVYRVELFGDISPSMERLFANYYMSLKVGRTVQFY